MIGSIQDWLIVGVVIALLFGGATQLPKLFRNAGRSIGEFNKGKLEVEKELKEMENEIKSVTPDTIKK